MSESESPTSTRPDQSPKADTFDELSDAVTALVSAAGLDPGNDQTTVMKDLRLGEGGQIIIAQIHDNTYINRLRYHFVPPEDEAAIMGSTVIKITRPKGIPGFRSDRSTHVIFRPGHIRSIIDYPTSSDESLHPLLPHLPRTSVQESFQLGFKGTSKRPGDSLGAEVPPNQHFGAPGIEQKIIKALNEATAKIRTGKVSEF